MSDLIEQKQRKNSLAPTSRPFPARTLLIAAFAALGLAACGGGGDNEGGGGGPGYVGPPDPNLTDDIPTTTSLAQRQGLTNDANRDYRLFYVDASNDNGKTGIGFAAAPWLMAYDPITGGTEAIDKKLQFPNSAYSPSALHEGDIDSSSGEMTNYRVSSVSYINTREVNPGGAPITFTTPDALMKVGVAPGSTPNQVTNESGDSRDLGLIGPRQIIAYNLKEAEKAQYAFLSDKSGNPYRLISLDADDTTPVKDFGSKINVQVPLHEVQGANAGTPYGWVAVNENNSNSNCLAFVPNSNLNSADCIPNADGTGNVTFDTSSSSPITGHYPVNNGVVLAIPEPGSAGSITVNTTLWFYEQSPASGDAGKLHLLLNNGKKLQTTGLPMFGPNQAGRVISRGGDTLYLAASDGGLGTLFGGSGGVPDISELEEYVYLFKITTAGQIGWEQLFEQGGKLFEDKDAYLGGFLVDTGSDFIWEVNERLIAISPDGQSETLLDGRTNDGGDILSGTGAFKTPVGAVSQGGWFFYNRENDSTFYATAIKTDGSKRVELKNCNWIGASTTGKAKYTGGAFAGLEPSEVFMACNNQQIAAVDASNPEAGRVILGTLPKAAEAITMGRSAPGPHRLIRVVYEGANNDSFEVVSVNTRESDSLNHLMASPASDDDVEVGAGSTAPVGGF